MKINADNKKKITDLVYNILATLIMNCILQFLCYPLFEKKLGEEINGIVLTLISIVSITAGTLGAAGNYSRIVSEREIQPSNGDYNIILLIGSIICVTVGIVFLWINNLLTPLYAILYSLVIVFTAFRYYGDVEFRLQTNFLQYFIYYLFISVGYVIGIIIFNFVGYWSIAILLGEVLGVGYAFFKTDLFRKRQKITKNFKLVLNSFLLIILSSLLDNLTLNADRLVLLTFTNGTNVTYYYVASLFGKVIALLTVPVNSLIISYLVRYNGQLTKKLWLTFIMSGIVLGILAIIGCYVGSIIIIPLLYDFFSIVRPILVPAIISQVFFFVSSVLLVILLRFFGEQKQFLLNLIYGIIFFIATIISTKIYGLNGFVWSSLAVNALRFILFVIFGFILKPKKPIIIENTEN